MPKVGVAEAIRLLQAGQQVGIPTETVYGLAARAADPQAVAGIFTLKGRPPTHPLIVHVAGPPDTIARYDAHGKLLMTRFWPGPLTLVLWRRLDGEQPGVPDAVTGGRDTVAVRCPAHPLALALIWAVGPLAAPSANRFGMLSPSTAEHVLEAFPDLPVVDGGPCSIGVESTILDLSGPPALLRPGGVPVEAIEALIGPVQRGGETAAPGTLPAHYAPQTRLLLSTTPKQTAAELRAMGLRVGMLKAQAPAIYARILYAELRRLDAEGVDVIVAEVAEAQGIGLAVNDRLRRAAAAFI